MTDRGQDGTDRATLCRSSSINRDNWIWLITSSANDMNLCKMYPWFIAVCMTIGGVLAHRGGDSFLAGAAGGLMVAMLPMALLGATVGMMLAWCPERPVCICGKCHSKNYDYVGPMHKPEDATYYYRCPKCERGHRSCGDRYDVKTESGFQPYLLKSKWKRWTRNTEQSHAEATSETAPSAVSEASDA